VKTLTVMLKDLRLISRDRFGLMGLLVVPIVVIIVVATATQSDDGTKGIVFPVVNEDQGPVATALIRALREHSDVHVVSRTEAHHLVAESNDAPAALILPPELSKRYLAQKPSTVELLTDPAQWQELEAIKVVMLLADRETASLGDPFSQELLTVSERSITGDHLSFSALEQNIPGFSLMFVLLTLIFSVSLALREEEVWNTSARLSIAPISPASLLGGKLLARLIVGTAQLLLLLLFGHFVYGLRLGHSPIAMITVAAATVASMTCFAAVVAAFVRTREQAIPVGLAVAFVLASLGGLFWPLYDLPRSMQAIARVLMTTWSMSAIQDVMLRGRNLTGVSSIIVQRGEASDADLQRARDGGLTDCEIVEIVANVVLNIFMNYLDHVARPIADFPQVKPDVA
jgi:ABC-2 type transport system permease protein